MGLGEEKFSEVSGVKTAIMCHKTGFMISAKTKEDVTKLVEVALKVK